MTASVSAVRGGFSYERFRLDANGWPDFMTKLESAMRALADENPDSILVKMERPS